MKKTIHINLAGHAFSIDEDAFERLDAYLKAVENKLGQSEEAKETLDDINLRIAELFRSVHADAASAITLTDVEEIIKTLGDPGDYETPEDPDDGTFRKDEKSFMIPPGRKQLFRDPDNRVLGGVCSGLGNYFGLDPILFRLLFIVATLFYGASFIAYLILWIAIPKAVNVQQRIMMMGGTPGSDSWRKRQTSRTASTDPVNGILRVLAVILGVVLIIVSFVSLTGLIVTFSLSEALFGSILGQTAWLPELDSLFLLPEQRLLAFIGISLTAGIPLLVLFYLGMHLVFRFKKGGPAFLITALILWLAGIGLVIYSGVTIASGYATSSSVEETTLLKVPASDTIYIGVNQASLSLGDGEYFFSHEGLSVRKLNNKMSLIGTPDIDVTTGTEEFSIRVNKQARGKNTQLADDYANRIEFFHLQNDSILLLDRYFNIQSPAIIRNQKVFVDISIPEGKEVKIASELKYLTEVSQ